MKKNHEILFTPMKVGGVTIQNRFVHAPMDGTSPIEGLLDSHQYLIERAKNGVGLIIPGITCVKNLSGNKWLHENGGSLENRCRFVTDIIKAIKKECGEDYPVIVRYSVTSKMRGFNKGAVPGEIYDKFGRDYEESIACAKILEEAGADALDADNGSYDSWFWAHPPVYMPLACILKDAAFIKKHVKIPVFCAGRMENPDTSAKAIKDGLIDGVAIGRRFLADGEYCKKVKEGKTDDIRPCIACHNGCFAISQLKIGGTGMNLAGNGHCAINPYTLEENK